MATPDRAEKVAIRRLLAQLRERSTSARAIDTYLNVTNLDENDVEALDALSRLYEKTEITLLPSTPWSAWRSCSAIRRSRWTCIRIGRILEDKLGERNSAVRHSCAPSTSTHDLPSLEALRKVYVDGGDWLAAARTLEQEIQHNTTPRVLTRLNVELGQIYRERLNRTRGRWPASRRHCATTTPTKTQRSPWWTTTSRRTATRRPFRSCSCW